MPMQPTSLREVCLEFPSWDLLTLSVLYGPHHTSLCWPSQYLNDQPIFYLSITDPQGHDIGFPLDSLPLFMMK